MFEIDPVVLEKKMPKVYNKNDEDRQIVIRKYNLGLLLRCAKTTGQYIIRNT